MKIKYTFLIISAFLFTGCSPVDKVKWSKIDLLGNEIYVKKIISMIQGNTGKVVWEQHPQGFNKECDIVSASINRKGTPFFLKFSYDRSKKECALIEYRVNGKPESPLYIYLFLSANKNNFFPGFLEQYLWIF